MGSCDSKSRTTTKTEVTQGNIHNERPEQIIENYQNNMPEKGFDEDIENYFVKPFTDFLPNNAKIFSKLICLISLENHGKKIIGTGFISGFQIDLEGFVCLMTNAHVISNESINNYNIIDLNFEGIKTVKKIKLDRDRRYIKSFRDEGLDITVVEILDEDNISKNSFLELESDIPINNELINNEIFYPQYIIKEKKFKKGEGIIKDISKYEFCYSAETEKGSSGNPIYLKNTYKIIGIHKADIKKEENSCDFIYPVINIIIEDIRKRSNNGKYIDGKYIYDDGKYYIGEFKNNKPNGKGIKYNKNGKILYDGDFINGKFEGNGKYINEDGLSYIGQWKNGTIHGKGILYYSNGNIKYKGDWVNNKYEGNGIEIQKNGYYYMGQFKNGILNGFAKEFDPNGNLKYQGDWVNNIPEGNGEYFWEDGYYYIGQIKNGLRNGKGTMYYPNGSVNYEGDWVNEKYEGNGKLVLGNGDYYIGRFYNGEMDGKGTLYYSDGRILRKGNFIKNTWFNDYFK